MANRRKKKKSYSKLILFNGAQETVQFELDAQNETATFEKQVLKRGTFKHPQDPTREIIFDDDYFEEIVAAFEANALDNVPIIIGTHDEEQTERIVGRVTALEIREGGLYAIMEIADSELIEKIDTELEDGKGIIDEVSVQVGPISNDEGESFKVALWHVAIVTHAWFTGMDSFERLSAMLKAEDKNAKFVLLMAEMSLEDQAQRVRGAFYDQLPYGMDYYDYYVEGVYESYIIVHTYRSQDYFRYSYDEDDDGKVIFEAGVKVEKDFKEVDVDIAAILDALKENGVEVESIDELKAAIAKAAEEHEPDPELVSAAAMLQKVSAILSPSEGEDGDAEPEKVQASAEQVVADNKTRDERIATLEATILNNEADNAVAALVNAGKVIPAQKEHYETLYKTDKDLFKALTADMETVITTGTEGVGSGVSDNAGGDTLDIQSEVDRIAGAYVSKKGE